MKDLEVSISTQPLPPVFERQGRRCYLDPVRKKLIYITPEETVRQQVLSFLMKRLKVPVKMIREEEPLVHYGIESRGRADLLIDKYDPEKNELHPLCVIECKARHIMLDENVHRQMIGYCDALGCDYGMVTNGEETFCYHFNQETNEYDSIENLPDYFNLIKGEYVKIPDEAPLPRLRHDEIEKNWDAYLGADMGEGTPKALLVPLTNLWECLLYSEHLFPPKQYSLFRVISDMGVRMLSYGNAGGGLFQGAYRSFMIEYKGNAEIVSLGFSPYSRHDSPKKAKTAICVAIDNEKETHHALQLVADDNIQIVGNRIDFYHHGRIAVGNKGSGKVEELRAFIAGTAPAMIDGKRFYLGSLVDDHLWNLDEPDVMKVIENFISYGLIRDEFRAYVKGRI